MARKLITTLNPTTDTASYTYTGKGVGKVDFVAEVTNDEGTFVSEPYEILDCALLDIATTGKANENAFVYSTDDIDRTVGDNGTLVENKKTTQVLYLTNKAGTTAFTWDWTTPFSIEVDLKNATANNIFLQIHNSDNSTVVTIPYASQSDFQHIKINVGADKTERWVDGVKGTDLSGISPSGSQPTLEVRFILNSGCEFTYRNFKIYPI